MVVRERVELWWWRCGHVTVTCRMAAQSGERWNNSSSRLGLTTECLITQHLYCSSCAESNSWRLLMLADSSSTAGRLYNLLSAYLYGSQRQLIVWWQWMVICLLFWTAKCRSSEASSQVSLICSQLYAEILDLGLGFGIYGLGFGPGCVLLVLALSSILGLSMSLVASLAYLFVRMVDIVQNIVFRLSDNW